MGTRNQFDKTKMPTPAVQEAELSRRMTPSEKDRRIHELEVALASQIEITNTERGHAERCAQKLNALAAQPAPGVGVDARLEELAYVPGAWRCPKCSLRLIAQTLHMQDGGMSANNQPQACANGCGPMWRVTEREDRQDAQRFANEQTDKLNALLATRPTESVAQGGMGGIVSEESVQSAYCVADAYIDSKGGDVSTLDDGHWGEMLRLVLENDRKEFAP